MNTEFEKYLTQEVAMCMHEMHMTQQPKLLFFKKGGDEVLEFYIHSYLTNPDILNVKKQNKDLYLVLAGCHALGCGGYVTLNQYMLGKYIADFTVEENLKITKDLCETDPYELFCKTLNIAPDSGNKKCLDYIVQTATQKAQQFNCENLYSDENIKTFMKVLYGAGITTVRAFQEASKK